MYIHYILLHNYGYYPDTSMKCTCSLRKYCYMIGAQIVGKNQRAATDDASSLTGGEDHTDSVVITHS